MFRASDSIFQEYTEQETKPISLDLRDTYDRIIRKVIRRGKDIGYFPGINEKIAGFMIASMITRTRIWLHPKGELSVGEVADFIFEFALNGLRGSH